MLRTVYFHIGSGKTGTSAIQVALARNRELLDKHGLIYPEGKFDARAGQGLITSGNGDLLAGFLWPEESPWPDADAIFGRLEESMQSRPGSSLVYSSEKFESCAPERFADLCARLERNGVRVKIIYYVRHLMDKALSSYNQAVKRNGYHREFSALVKQYRSKYADTIRAFSNLVGRDNLIVRLYENEKDRLVEGFLRILFDHEGIPAETIAFEDTAIVNRSLTRRELDVMRFVNKLVEDKRTARQVSTIISDRIVRSSICRGDDFPVTPEELRTLEQNNYSVPGFVNEFVGGTFELKFKSDKIAVGARHAIELNECDARYRPAIASLIAHINGYNTRTDLKSKLESDHFTSYRNAPETADGAEELYRTVIGALIDFIAKKEAPRRENARAVRANSTTTSTG